ncbi:preprotein translocase subunit YajC [Cellulomonas endophytica]|uniref:preprotein translocase subunit YajC n=1 Tax=Cellulomonas endophytica TaxID=2494735 RepID=UPI001F0CD241|nr:preprotein translocase subunit YajC [Cellulomonas endophytica]
MDFLLIVVLMGAVLWFMTRNGRKQQKEAANFRSNLAPGDEVMTGSGLFGTVVAVDGDVITLESTPGQPTRWLRAAIAKRVDPPAATDEDEDDDEYEDDDEAYEDEYDDAYDDDDTDGTDADRDLDPDGTRRATGTAATATASTTGATALEVPDDLSGLPEADRRDGGPETGTAR